MKGSIADQTQKLALMHDLELGCTWSGTNPIMYAALSELLESEGKIGEAIAVLTEAAKREPELYVRLANLAHRHGRKQPLERAAAEAKRIIQQRIATQKATSNDYFSLANVFLLETNPDAALQIASEGLAKDPENPQLKRMLSETHRFKYVKALENNTSNVSSQNLAMLDAALKADPTNPSVTQEVARLIALGSEATPELAAALEAQLESGQASVMTHILLAGRAIKNGEIAKAIPHYEIALRAAPNSPVILNNLALAIAMTKPEDMTRALELIGQALKFANRSAEYHDTQGQIRLLQGDKVGAITSFETAIELDPSRISTRQQLAGAYEAAGMLEMTKVQQAAIAKLQSQQPPKP
jgi:tetratricopeptide (TPR) repeat protein